MAALHRLAFEVRRAFRVFFLLCPAARFAWCSAQLEQPCYCGAKRDEIGNNAVGWYRVCAAFRVANQAPGNEIDDAG
jgi:hypothetical protein